MYERERGIMKKYNVAILGATGAVGQEMIKVLSEYKIPAGKLLQMCIRDRE